MFPIWSNRWMYKLYECRKPSKQTLKNKNFENDIGLTMWTNGTDTKVKLSQSVGIDRDKVSPGFLKSPLLYQILISPILASSILNTKEIIINL